MAKVNVQWRGEVVVVEICRDAARTAELQQRWGGGPVIIERVFEIESRSSVAARCNLANKVLRMFGERLQLDSSLSRAELHAQLQTLSPDAPPLPKQVTAPSAGRKQG